MTAMILMNTDFQERTPTFPMLVTPLKRPQKTTTHERIRHRQRRHCSVWPSSSWKPSEMSSMKLLLGILAISKNKNNDNSGLRQITSVKIKNRQQAFTLQEAPNNFGRR